MPYKKRKYGLGIWGLGLGYYLFYTPYSGLTKALSDGILPGVGRVPGAVLLPASAAATAVVMFGFITVMGWWKYAGRRKFFGVSVPFPQRLTFLSGVCLATIIGATTLAFTFGGVSIVLVLVLLRGGILIIAPVVDSITKRRVRWFSWAAMLVSLLAVSVVLADTSNYSLSLAAVGIIAAYLAAYFFKLQFMTRLSKSEERGAAMRYFVEEQLVASPLLVLALGVMAAIGAGDVMAGFRVGFTTFLLSDAAWLALLVGLFYAGLCVCTTFIFLDCRENTFCVPMHCSSSMLSGVTASFVLALLFQRPAPGAAQLASAGLIIVALAFLSPLHHLRRQLDRLARSFAGLRRARRGLTVGPGLETFAAQSRAPSSPENAPASMRVARGQEQFEGLKRVFLFVCSGNTCRSPMAAAIGNAHIAERLKIPFETLDGAGVKSLSAGVSARVGAPMTPEAQQALSRMGVPVPRHSARNLTAELARQVEMIFCMTRAHRKAVIDSVPSAAGKTYCLDPDSDIEDPIGGGLEDYLKCAQHIHRLVSRHLDKALPSPSL
jgi:protein-tyrosine-phosphatase